MRHAAILLLVASLSVVASAEQLPQGQSCAASPLVRDSSPPDPNADPVGSPGRPENWYINADRTIWIAVPEGGWSAGGRVSSGGVEVRGHKSYWVRPQGTQLVISGRRIDANAPPLEAYIPCCYRTGFQIVVLLFPTEGCWEVTAKAGGNELRFVTQVKGSARE